MFFETFRGTLEKSLEAQYCAAAHSLRITGLQQR